MPRARSRGICCVCGKAFSAGAFVGWDRRKPGERWHALCRRIEKAQEALEVPAEEPDATIATTVDEKPRETPAKTRRETKTRPEWGPEETAPEETCSVCLSPITSFDAIGWSVEEPKKHYHLMCRRDFSHGLEKFVQLVVERELERREKGGRYRRPRPLREMAVEAAVGEEAGTAETAVTGARSVQDASSAR